MIYIIIGIVATLICIWLVIRLLSGADGRGEPENAIIAACEANDFTQARKLASRIEYEWKRDEALGIVANAEAMYLCDKGDSQSIDRIISMLSSSYPIDNDSDSRMERIIKSYETRCDALISYAIAHKNYDLARRVLPFYPFRPSGSFKAANAGYIVKDRARQRVIDAVSAGVFPEAGEKEVKELSGL